MRPDPGWLFVFKTAWNDLSKALQFKSEIGT
jgi:hypothetical protein